MHKAIGSCHVIQGANDRKSTMPMRSSRNNAHAAKIRSYLASLTRRCTPTQENGHDGCLRWWEVVVLLVGGAHGRW